MEAALRNFLALADTGQVRQYLIGIHINHRGSHRHLEDHIFTLGTRAVTAAAGFTVFRLVAASEPVVDQRIQRLIRFHIDGTAITAVAAVRATLGNVFLAPEAQTPVASLAGFHRNGCLIDKFHRHLQPFEYTTPSEYTPRSGARPCLHRAQNEKSSAWAELFGTAKIPA